MTIVVLVVVSLLPSLYDSDLMDMICFGIAASILASFIFYLLSTYAFDDPNHRDTMSAINTVSANLKKIADSPVIKEGVKCDEMYKKMNEGWEKIEKNNQLKKYYEKGFKSIRNRDDIENKKEYWHKILEHEEHPLDIASRTLTPWFGREYLTHFKNSIFNRINNGQEVHILVLNPYGSTLKEYETQTKKHFSVKTKDTLKTLKREIYTKLTPHQKVLFQVKIIDSIIPYIYIDNGVDIMISPYMHYSTGHDKGFVAIFTGESQYIAGFKDDFNTMFKAAKNVDWELVK